MNNDEATQAARLLMREKLQAALAKTTVAEFRLNEFTTTLVEQWIAQVITNREFANMMADLHYGTCKMEPGALDLNTGLRYPA